VFETEKVRGGCGLGWSAWWVRVSRVRMRGGFKLCVRVRVRSADGCRQNVSNSCRCGTGLLFRKI